MKESRDLVRLAKFILGAKKDEKLSDSDLKYELKQMRIPHSMKDGPDDIGGGWIAMEFRNHDFFTQGEDDDDWPEFSGYSKVVKLVERHFSTQLRKKQIDFEVEESEKSWFTVMVKAL